MANVNIKEVNGGEVTTLSSTDGIEIDTGSTSVWIKISNFAAEIFKRIKYNVSAITVTTTNVTAAENTTYNLTITGLTANRNFVLPAPSAAGVEISVSIADGDDTYFIILIGDTGVSINGGSAATEFHRLQTKGRSATFRATSTTNWQLISGCDEIQVTFTPFLALPPFTSNDFWGVCAISYPFQLIRVEWNYFVATTNDGTKYWTVRVDDNGGTVSSGTPNTSAGTASVWNRGTAHTAFSKTNFTSADRHLLVFATKTSTPGGFYGTASAVIRLS